MAVGPIAGNEQAGKLPPDINSPMEIIDILGSLTIDGKPIIVDDKMHTNPQAKAEHIIKYFNENFDIKPNELPHLASIVKMELQSGKLGWEIR